MASLRISIDGDVLKKARIRAREMGTSVNAVVREHLDRFVSDDETGRDAIRRILDHAEALDVGTGAAGRTWTRDDLYEERLGRSSG